METFSKQDQPVESSHNKRRNFLKQGVILSVLTGAAGLNLLTSCKEEEEDILPAEDLMCEHGVLNRVLLIYDACRGHLMNNEQFPLDALWSSAQIIRTFIEDSHEKQEEDFLFPRFEKANRLTDLVKVLRAQHNAGRVITAQILQLSSNKKRG